MLSRDLDVWAVGVLLVVGLGLAGLTMATAPDAPPSVEPPPSDGEGAARFVPFAGGVMQPPTNGPSD